MKQKILTILSLLTSLMLLVFAGSAFGSVTVKFLNKSFYVGRTGQTILMEVTASQPISMFDVVGQVVSTSGGAFGTITGISCDKNLTQVDGVSPDVFRLWDMNLGSCDNVLDAGTSVPCTLTVNIGCAEGTFSISPTGINWNIDAYTTATTTFVSASCEAEVVTGVVGVYTVTDNAPVFLNCPTEDLVFGCNEVANYDFDANDIDLGLCGEDLTFSLCPGTPGSINPTTGAWTWSGSVGEVGVHNFCVKVKDTYNKEAICNFTVIITNLPPVVDYCPPEYTVPFDGISKVWVCFGDEAFGDVDAHDQDVPVCPGPLTYYLESFNGPGTFYVDAMTGEWTWQTDDEPGYAGVWHVVIGVTDGVPEDDVFCEFDIRVTGIEVKVAKTGEDEFVFQGSYTEVPIYAFTDNQDIGGVEFLMTYDASALTFIEATLGDYLLSQKWEYFYYRTGPFGNCGGQCPSGLVRLIGINDVNNGIPHPTWPGSWIWPDSIMIAKLKFFVTDDRTYECQYIPIGFFWLDCGDNTFADSSGYQIFISRNVYWYNPIDDQYLLLDPADNPYIAGWQSIPGGQDCDSIGDPNKPFPLGCVDFYMGGVDIACADSIALRGDLNLNNIANEIGDAVLYTNFFIYGPSVFTVNLEGQVAASDVNNDGKVLTVGDLVYLIRIITNDAAPYEKLAPFASSVDVNLVNNSSGLTVSTNSGSDIGAAWFVFDVTGDAEIVPLVNGMDVKSNLNAGELRVLISNIGTGYVPAGMNELFGVVANGEVVLTQVQVVDYYGADLATRTNLKALPKSFAVSQNYPNPFNPTTDVTLSFEKASAWSLDVYNVSGQIVRSYSGYNDAGVISVTIDMNGMASGIYFYKATIGDFSQVRKMVLMK